MAGWTNALAAAVLARSPLPVDPGLIPTVLAAAFAEVLEVDGAGLSLIGGLRVPLAASNSDARRAEQLQTTLGEGPCLTAVATGEPLAAGPGRMMQQWPIFHHELTRQTPFQSVACLPLQLGGEQPFGALDLYSTSPVPDLDLLEDPTRHEIVEVAVTFLTGAPLNTLLHPDSTAAPTGGPGDLVAERMNVWTAVGLLMAETGLHQPEALALLRAHAFSHTTTIDRVAHRLTSRNLPVQELVT